MDIKAWFLIDTGIVIIFSLIFASAFTLSKTVLLIFLLAGSLVFVVSVYKGTFGQGEIGVTRREMGTLYGFLIIIFSVSSFLISSFHSNHDRLTKFNDVQVGGKGLSISTRGYIGGNPTTLDGVRYVPLTVKELIMGERIFPMQETVLIPTSEELKPGEVLLVQGPLRTLDLKNITKQTAYFLRFGGVKSVFIDPMISESKLGSPLSIIDKSKIFFAKHGF